MVEVKNNMFLAITSFPPSTPNFQIICRKSGSFNETWGIFENTENMCQIKKETSDSLYAELNAVVPNYTYQGFNTKEAYDGGKTGF